MKLENQVVSLELSKKLKELGVRQESLWWWEKNKSHPMTDGYVVIVSLKDCSSAFTVAELGEMLPFGVDSGKTDYDLGKEKSFFCAWREDAYHEEKPDKIIFADTEANARAKCLIYLKDILK